MSKQSRLTNLPIMKEWVTRIIDDRETADFVFLDFAKIFYSLTHMFLFTKLRAYGFYAFLGNRYVLVLVNGRRYCCGEWSPLRFSHKTTTFPAVRQWPPWSYYWVGSSHCRRCEIRVKTLIPRHSYHWYSNQTGVVHSIGSTAERQQVWQSWCWYWPSESPPFLSRRRGHLTFHVDSFLLQALE